jgi:uncharacterized protein YndB with AHSA1/START domain
MILASISGATTPRSQEHAMSDTRGKSINGTVEIARSPHEVFEYIADPERIPEWQPDVRTARFDNPAAVGVGTRGREVRHVMGSDRSIRWEVTEYRPDQRYGVRGLGGPVRAHVTMDVSPNSMGAGTQLSYGIAFEGHGVGRLIAPLARKSARTDLPATLDSLKRQMEDAPR